MHSIFTLLRPAVPSGNVGDKMIALKLNELVYRDLQQELKERGSMAPSLMVSHNERIV